MVRGPGNITVENDVDRHRITITTTVLYLYATENIMSIPFNYDIP